MPVLGFGILGDRQFLSGGFVHNFIIEIITDFGFGVGIIFIIFIAVEMIRSIFNKRKQDAVFLIGCLTIIQLLFSSSYLIKSEFFILFGFLIAKLKTDRE